MKKALSIALVFVLLVALMEISVLAHGSRHSTKRYGVCKVESCTKTGVHVHSGKSYAAHYYCDGHDYHDYCEVDDCRSSGYHQHDGIYCFGNASGGGQRGLGRGKGCC